MIYPLILCLLLPLMGYSLSLSSTVTTIEEPVFRVIAGNPPGAEKPDFDDTAWQRVRFPTNLRSVLGESDDYWVRLALYVPHNAPSLPAISLGYLYASDAFYLNGTYEGGHGLFPRYENAHDVIRFYPLLNLIPGQTNLLAWHIRGLHRHYTGPIFLPPRMGPAGSLFVTIYGMDIVSLVFLIIYGVIAVYLLFFFVNRPSQKDYLSFGVFLIALITYYVARNQLQFFLHRNYTLTKQVEYIAYYALFPLFLLFMRVFFEDRSHLGRWTEMASVGAAGGGYLLALMANWDMAATYNYSFYQPCIMLPAVLYIIILLLRNFAHRKEARLFLGGFVFVIFAIIYDVGVARGWIPTLSITPFVFFAFIVSFALILANRFVLLYTELEDLNKHLEQKVQERTRELEESNHRLIQAQKQIHFELELAQRIQRSLMPSSFDSLSSVAVNGIYMPMEELGGDFYDIYTKPGFFHCVVADVSGHGVPSALIAMMAKALLSHQRTLHDDPAAIVLAVNQEMCAQLSDVENYLTLFYAVIDLTHQTLSYINAGHVPVLYIRNQGEVLRLEAQTPFLGKFEDLSFQSATIPVAAGDHIVLYTDGLVETRNEDQQFFGEENLLRILLANQDKSPEEISRLVIDELNHFRGSLPWSDDITLLVIQIPTKTSHLSEQDIGILYEKALKSYKQNHLEETERFLSLLMACHSLSDEDTYRVYILAGNLASQQQKWEKAYAYWTKALAIHPENQRLSANIQWLEKKLNRKS